MPCCCAEPSQATPAEASPAAQAQQKLVEHVKKQHEVRAAVQHSPMGVRSAYVALPPAKLTVRACCSLACLLQHHEHTLKELLEFASQELEPKVGGSGGGAGQQSKRRCP